MDKRYRVFESEERLYENHCLTKCEEKLFETSDSSILYPLLASGAARMKDKLCAYAEKQLPGGEYWQPKSAAVKKILTKIRPSNDLCESILGLNDYLTTAIPNLAQVARSNLVEIKKNHTMQWLHELPDDKQLKVLDLAIKERPRVAEEYRKAERERNQQR